MDTLTAINAFTHDKKSSQSKINSVLPIPKLNFEDIDPALNPTDLISLYESTTSIVNGFEILPVTSSNPSIFNEMKTLLEEPTTSPAAFVQNLLDLGRNLLWLKLAISLMVNQSLY